MANSPSPHTIGTLDTFKALHNVLLKRHYSVHEMMITVDRE